MGIRMGIKMTMERGIRKEMEMAMGERMAMEMEMGERMRMEMEMGERMRMEMEMEMGVRSLVEAVSSPVSGCCKMLKVLFGCWVMRFQGVLFIVFVKRVIYTLGIKHWKGGAYQLRRVASIHSFYFGEFDVFVR